MNKEQKQMVRTVNQLVSEAQKRKELEFMTGDTYKDCSTIIVIPTPWKIEDKHFLNCKKCKEKNEYTTTSINGLNPAFISSLKNLIKPMNVPCLEMYVGGKEVGEAYSSALDMILANPALAKFKYLLTIEHDNLIPFMPNTMGPMLTLYENMDKYDVVGGLYRLKGEPPIPLIYGNPKEKRNSSAGMFKVRYDWKPGDVVECNGLGMGFTLFKMEIFKDKRLKKPFFETINKHTDKGPALYTQDLNFFEKIRGLGYKCAVDTRVVLAHMDLKTGAVY